MVFSSRRKTGILIFQNHFCFEGFENMNISVVLVVEFDSYSEEIQEILASQ